MSKHEWIIRMIDEIGQYAKEHQLRGVAAAAPLLSTLAREDIERAKLEDDLKDPSSAAD
ncbi:hypothetical protein [Sagittula sp. SSi028]|uniref:hypothetical protein n=1 Tax=Sagittula sp. SSi028 TaxID=3400636 RepID=UPI003AF8421D